MNSRLDNVTKKLFVDMDELTDAWVLDTSDPENPVLVVNGAELPIDKDYMTYKGKTRMLPGVTVYAPVTGKAYVSRAAWYQMWKLGVL